MKLNHISGPFYQLVSESEKYTNLEHAKCKVRSLILSLVGADVADKFGKARLADLTPIVGGFYVRADGLEERESRTRVVQAAGGVGTVVAIGSAIIAHLIDKLWAHLTNGRDIGWTITNRLLGGTSAEIDLELIGVVTNQTPGSFGSGDWVSAKDSPASTIDYNDEMLLGTVSDGAGAIGMICYGFDLPGRDEGYGVVYMYAAAPLSTRSGGNCAIEYHTRKPKLTQDDLNDRFDSMDHSSLRSPAVSDSFSHAGTTYEVIGTFTGNDSLYAKLSLRTTQT